MAIDEATVRRAARLAALRLDEDAVQAMAQELGRILEWVSQLDDVDEEGVEPMTMAAHLVCPCVKTSSWKAATPNGFWPTHRSGRAASLSCRKRWTEAYRLAGTLACA